MPTRTREHVEDWIRGGASTIAVFGLATCFCFIMSYTMYPNSLHGLFMSVGFYSFALTSIHLSLLMRSSNIAYRDFDMAPINLVREELQRIAIEYPQDPEARRIVSGALLLWASAAVYYHMNVSIDNIQERNPTEIFKGMLALSVFISDVAFLAIAYRDISYAYRHRHRMYRRINPVGESSDDTSQNRNPNTNTIQLDSLSAHDSGRGASIPDSS